MGAERAKDLVDHLRDTLPMLSDDCVSILVDNEAYNLTSKDASTLISLDDGDRLEYYYDVVVHLQTYFAEQPDILARVGKVAGNW
jgi:aspartyl-tRNA(Asn)/glutamyl-tRNA(Gln) amidotransferase subunit B